MKKNSLFLLILMLFSFASKAQDAVLFEPSVISDGGVFGFTLSPDSKTALWVKSNGKRDTLLIMESQKVNGKWQKPTITPFSSQNGAWKDIDPVFSPDGKTVFFQSNRSLSFAPDRKGFDIWAVKRLKNGWSEPVHLGNTLNTDASESYASAAKNGNLYFMKENPDGKGSSDIYVSEISKNQYQTPVNIGSPVNTSFRESNPFVSSKEDFLIYFSSDSTQNFGEVDLYISFRTKEGWTKGLNLGKNINSADAEFCPFYHEKEKKLYFARQIKQPNGRFKEDIYVVPFDPKSFRKKAQIK